MDCNKDEAMRAKEIAEKKMQSNDFEGARRIVLKAKNLYPELENITQMLSICDVYCSAQIRLHGSEKDWYGVLQVEKLADESTIKKQYRRLALILHPDKNRFPGAEGAFKLICEANALLSDPSKKSLYDTKIKHLTRTAAANPPNQPTNRSNQFNQQSGAQNNASNCQHQATQSSIFWTCCPFCKRSYQYPREYANRCLQCPACYKAFTAYEVPAPHATTAKLGNQGVPSKPNVRKSVVSKEKVVTKEAHSEVGGRNVKVPPVSHAGSQGTGNMNTQPQPGARKRGGSQSKVASVAENLQKKELVNLNAGLHGEKVGVTSNGDPVRRESRNSRTKSQKRKKLVLESSDGSDSDIEDVTGRDNLGDDAATGLKSESTHAQSARRSSRSRHNVSYKEADEDYTRAPKRAQTSKEANGKVHKDAVDVDDSKHDDLNTTVQGSSKSGNQVMGVSKSTESSRDKNEGCDKEGEVRGVAGGRSSAPADTVEIESDSDMGLSSSKDSGTCRLEFPDPEFSDFDKMRDISLFEKHQFWALYDTTDSMPRFYAEVKDVRTSPFELKITWLEVVPMDNSWKRWVDEELPVGCGSFKIGTHDIVTDPATLSHQVHCVKGKKKGPFYIYPKIGEVWALFKDWDISWRCNVENHKKFRYEVVEVLSDFTAGIGINVAYLDKVPGFVSLFQRAERNEINSCLIGPKELYRFSHCVPSSKMRGTEREGVPEGSYELDPACVPHHEEMGKSAALESTCSPNKTVDLEGTKTRGDVSSIRRSPRVGKTN